MSDSVAPSAPAPVTSTSAPEVASSPSSEPKSSEPKAPEAPKSFKKLKVDGEEIELGEEEVIKYAQLGKAKEKRFEESSRLKKEADAKLARLKDNPWEVLKELGIDPRKVSEEYLSKVLEDEMLTPQERAQRDRDRKLEEYEKKEAESKTKAQEAEFEAQKLQHIEKLDQELDAALQNSSLPKSPGVIRRVAKYLYDALEAGEDVSVEEAMAWVEEDYSNEVSQFFGSAKDPSKYLPKDLAKKLMDSHLSQVKAAPKYSQEQAKQQTETPQKTISSSDWMKKIMS